MSNIKTKHTPGPWHTNSNAGFIYDTNGFNIAQVYGVDTEVNESEDIVMHANAKLISCAPELLAWTIELLGQVKRDNPDRMAGVVEHVENLILRATGGEL